MENACNTSNSFVLLGIVEIEGSRFLHCVLCFLTYSFTLFFSLTILFVIWAEQSLHEPMYILIGSLVLNGIFGSSVFMPKMMVDLLKWSNCVSRVGCFTQAFCIGVFPISEISIFTIMAYDTYIAVCHPLRYPTLMTKETVLYLLASCYIINFVLVLIAILLVARLPLCGTQVRGIFCDNMVLVYLSCVDNSINYIYGTVMFSAYLIVCMLLISYSYLQISLVCLRLTSETCKRSVHTLVTHILNFSVFLIGVLFVFIRYRVGRKNSAVLSVFLCLTTFVLPPFLYPLIYGVRTKKLNTKVLCCFKKMNKGVFRKF
ncbi:olfactory receptor 6B2-like [Xenopus laevis]|uniref:Olfactory receptor 6B2-like n=1 Tax=Xenopus laevis TaxID=8355 RepID=A0A8J1M7H3_XENLA|nr:olfactory receptor 6B2-like [Xenopus laevis]